MFQFLATWLINRAKSTPYFHLYHGNGSLYMERYWVLPRWLLVQCPEQQCLVPRAWLPVQPRLHIIHTPDLDRHMHDHPRDFVSVVLLNYYVEARPLTTEPCFYGKAWANTSFTDTEREVLQCRRAGSVAYRRATDRHSIVHLSDAGPVCTLFIFIGPKRHWWGFYTPAGKVHWKVYESVHNNKPHEAAA